MNENHRHSEALPSGSIFFYGVGEETV